jgi:hypothetical protein
MLFRQLDPNLGRSGKAHLSLEGLEDRTCPTTLSLQGTTLVITGNATDNTIVVRDLGNGNVDASLENSHGKVIDTLDAKNVQTITINSFSGDENVDYTLTNTLKTAKPHTLNISTGNGENNVKLNLAKGVTDSTLNVNLHTGSGFDVINAVFGAISASHVNTNVDLGNGIAQANLQVSGAVTGDSVFNVVEKGGKGFDGLNFDMNGTIAAGSAVNVDLTGGTNSDTLDSSYHGLLDGKLTILAKGGGGGDWNDSYVGVSTDSTGSLQDHLIGGTGGDMLILKLQGTAHLKTANASIAGSTGFDEGVVSKGVKVTNVLLT